jgi:hypothetical protein
MEVSNHKDLTYTEVANAIRPGTRGPINQTMVEHRLSNIRQQKYQYYGGDRSVTESPFKPNGVRNQNFTSPNFLSNAVFYEPSKNLGISKHDMYKTTTNMLHSSSFDKLQAMRDMGDFRISGRKNNQNLKNMTTFDVEIGKNISDIYKQRLGNRSSSVAPARDNNIQLDISDKENAKYSKPQVKFDNNVQVPQKFNGESRNHNSQKPLARSETVPALRPQMSTEAHGKGRIYNN